MKNDLLLKAAKGEDINRYPVWLMRQAGRILPEYRAVRNSLNGFKALVKNPELCCEVTIQPVDILEVDAAIIFSDILVVPEAMGLNYEMIEKKGPWFEKTIRNEKDMKLLDLKIDVKDRLHYVFDAIKQTKNELKDRVPLIGFAGAPWTIFCYMVDGQGSKTFSESRKILYQNPILAHDLLSRITNTTIQYLKEQINSGADLIQVFDSWAGILPKNQYQEFCMPYLRQITNELKNTVPLTIFSKGAISSMNEICNLNCNTVGLDWTMNISETRKIVGETKTIQGNLDPCVLYSSSRNIVKETQKLLDSLSSKRHIINLGHGVYPDTDPENVKTFINTIKNHEIN